VNAEPTFETVDRLRGGDFGTDGLSPQTLHGSADTAHARIFYVDRAPQERVDDFIFGRPLSMNEMADAIFARPTGIPARMRQQAPSVRASYTPWITAIPALFAIRTLANAVSRVCTDKA
jgi:hypothetical protein